MGISIVIIGNTHSLKVPSASEEMLLPVLADIRDETNHAPCLRQPHSKTLLPRLFPRKQLCSETESQQISIQPKQRIII